MALSTSTSVVKMDKDSFCIVYSIARCGGILYPPSYFEVLVEELRKPEQSVRGKNWVAKKYRGEGDPFLAVFSPDICFLVFV